MKILLIHADFIEWKPEKKAIKAAEDVEKKAVKVEEALVVLASVEKGDENNPSAVAKKTVKEVIDVFREVKAKSIVIYPYAHLSSDLSKPDVALNVLKEMESLLKKEGVPVHRAPFGWYKSFNLKAKGHPLSELSRIITAEGVKEGDDVSEAIKQEEKVISEWFILEPSGKLHPVEVKGGKVEGYGFGPYRNLEKFAHYEMAKSREIREEPPHVKLMRRLELVDYEPGSDPGNFRFYPKGRLMKSLLETWVTQRVVEYGGMEVETPIMYDYEHPALKDYLNRFPARQYILQSAKKKFFLRFAACFGQFLMAANSNISYRNLPMKIYELTRYSFRLEKAGELTGLRRLRSFTMPDMHTLCADMDMAKEEFGKQFRLCMRCLNDIGFGTGDYETAIRFTREFWDGNKDMVVGLARLVDKPVLIERWNFRFAYFDPKFEFNFVDAIDKAAALSTVQIDHENAQRYGMQYTGKDNTRKHPMILHCSPSGAIERVIYALLEKAHKEQRAGPAITSPAGTRNPVFPLWLSPVQIRLCPVNDSLVKYCGDMAHELVANSIRVDIDDRVESIGRKIRDAEVEWIPYIVVVGEKEMESGKLAVRVRQTGSVISMSSPELVKVIIEQTSGFPFKPLSLPMFLTQRPGFVG
ncbi:MAG: threonine--tRNA ligase [Candidatus Aenigmarchaeota archaeon]|nr:threonine--tRNA ligase [Candidatus Aenigmarchaeota archaeon]